MAVKLTGEQELYKHLRAGDIRSCYFFFGKDVASLESASKRLISKLCPDDARDLNYHFFDGSDFDLSVFSDVCESLPMFAERVVAAVNDLNAESLRADDLKALCAAVSGLDPETTTVIFYATGTDLCGGKKTLSAKNQKLAEAVVKAGGEAVEFAYKRPQDLVKPIRDKAARRGSEITDSAAIALAQACLCNMLMINNEIEKLSAYRAGGTITEEDVDELVAGQLDTDAYKLARAVASGNTRAAFESLSELYSRQQESIPLLAVIGGAFLDLYRAKLALMSNRGESDVVSDFSYRGREFAVRNAMRDCQRVPVERLRYCLGVLAECDADMKSKKTDKRILLEEAIIRMMNPK